MLYISIPCRFVNKMLTIKALKLAGVGETEQLALHAAISHTALYDSLELSTIEHGTDKHNNPHMFIVAPFSETLMKEINRIEPTPENKISYKGLLAQPSAEEVLKYGHEKA